MSIIYFLILGLAAGGASGLIGIGGGIIMIPVLIFAFKFSQKLAQGTTLAVMVLPIGLLAACEYYRQHNVDLKAAGLISLGFFVGAYLGADYAKGLSNAVLQKIFGATLLAVGVKMVFFK